MDEYSIASSSSRQKSTSFPLVVRQKVRRERGLLYDIHAFNSMQTSCSKHVPM
ncbi:MAG: hypothetical protein MR970_05910 [Spirochaetia bacterium]|nr:hypothetical protein [Spirochaetia bacterium]MDD7698385.1 hypothetical protein [Spirochaetia bacterium]MDY4210512.1 hypothetical protein [Treponema sp.]